MFNDGTSKKLDQSAQPSGMPAGSATRGGRTQDAAILALFEVHDRLRDLQPDPDERAKLLGVTPAVEAAWIEGRMLPVLRARGATMRSLVARLEYDVK